MKKITSLAAIVAASALALSACSGGDSKSVGSNSDYKACLVSDQGGWDDKSFNESAFNGLKVAEKDLKVKTGTSESKGVADFGPNVDAQVADGCNLIIGVGFMLAPATLAAAQNNPDINFALIDSAFTDKDNKVVPLKNGRPLVFNTAEAAYLAGYAAAGMTKTGTVATFGGMPIPSVTVFMDGFADGVKAYNEAKGKNVKLLGWDKAAQTGSFTNSFEDQNLGKTQTQQFIDQGADIVMPVAGPVGLGAAAAAKADGKTLIVGVDSDWYESTPDYKAIVLTSVMKQIDKSVIDTVKIGSEGKFTSEPYIGTLENGGVSLAPFHDFDSKVPADLKDEIKKLSDKIKSGDLKIESKSSPKTK
ncbi:BMP family lipoprotein [Arcanobacterium bovis]|uniref:BMP family ABC transporter substrate-binding protein n=1 Tax=Arcanobacterium bovis TaxID=2529275 RepID=A0A4Q9V0J1_9ACTO|nr:BMP family ABC transporter substrate-binding protein [Arcanobacterium bovis]TBW22148.1 BMP family ABC transporter substrate-binding protein [Arcanobacterium bovis]